LGRFQTDLFALEPSLLFVKTSVAKVGADSHVDQTDCHVVKTAILLGVGKSLYASFNAIVFSDCYGTRRIRGQQN
jgi:hypothetical protein